MILFAEQWDTRYKEINETGKDTRKLADILREAQSMNVKTPLMIQALSDLKLNSSWMNEGQRFFNNQSRATLTMMNLTETISKIDEVKDNPVAM